MIAKLKQFLKQEKAVLLILVVAFVFMVLVMTKTGSGDLQFFATWMKYFVQHGLPYSYAEPTYNYLPAITYFFNLLGWGMTLARVNIDAYIYMIKPFLLLINIFCILIVILISRRYKIPRVYSLLIFFNIAFLYDSYLWGQLDIVIAFLILGALYFSLSKKPTAAAITYLIALNCKPQALPFLPFFLVLIGFQILSRRKLIKVVISLLATELILLLPFLLVGQLGGVLNVLRSTTLYYPVLTNNALNFWMLIFINRYAGDVSDLETFIGISYRLWGIALFALSSLAIMIPVTLNTWRLRKQKFDFQLKDVSFYALSICMIAFSFFMFTTQMHERYLDAAILFAGLYAITSKRYIFYILISIAYFLNINKYLGHFEIQSFITILNSSHGIAALMTLVFVFGFYEFGRMVFNKKPAN